MMEDEDVVSPSRITEERISESAAP